MAPADKLFRKSSVERLASPEQLDQLMQITSPRGWIALVGLTSLLVAALVWSVLGRVSTRLTSSGMLIQKGGLFEIVSLGEGQLVQIAVGVGDVVHRDQIVAQLAQPELIERIEKARAALEELRAEHLRVAESGGDVLRLRTQAISRQRDSLLKAIRAAESRQEWLAEKLRSQATLVERGLVTKGAYVATKQQKEDAEREAERGENELQQLLVQARELEREKESQVASSQSRINDAERSLSLLEEQHEGGSKVRSPKEGRVVEVRAEEGSLLRPGSPIANLELIGESLSDLEAILFVAPAEGKSVRPGMTVQIAPSTVKPEEHGFMLGVVRSVGDYPVTRNGMMRLLQNEELVTSFLRESGGAPIPVRADLIPDPATTSGYRWSSASGPPARIHSGTLCRGHVTIREQRPIGLFLPILRQYLGV